MKALLNILSLEKTNLGKIDLIEQLEKTIMGLSIELSFNKENKIKLKKINILTNIVNEIRTKQTWGKNQLKDLFLEKILNNL